MNAVPPLDHPGEPPISNSRWLPYSALAAVICLAVYWNGLRCWFFQDDFAWLGLGRTVHSFRDLLHAMFAPMAQGTIRPWSERLYFMGLSGLFGIDALPFRIVAFVVQTANLLLLGAVAYRLTRRRGAAFCAPLVWGLNPGLALPMSWSSSFNQLLCAFFLLAAFLLFLMYVETGNRRYYLLQAVVFLLGFGALEINVVYPALAAAYALLAARRYLWSVVPLGVVSIVYTLVHNHFAPKAPAGPYAMHLDSSILATLIAYWKSSFAWGTLSRHTADPWIAQAAAILPWLFTAAMFALLAWSLSRRDWRALFPFAWFLICIAPVLPLRDHFSGYYLTIPAIGLGLFVAQALKLPRPGSSGWLPIAPAMALTALYLGAAIPASRNIVDFNRARSRVVRDLVWGVESAHDLHPGKAILLQGVSTGMFWSAINDKPFRLLGIEEVYLTPDAADSIQRFPDLGNPDDHILPPIATLRALNTSQAVVYSVASFPIRNITSFYKAAAASRLRPDPAAYVDVGNRFFDQQIGPGWYPAETGYRWMGRRAVVWLGHTGKAASRLRVTGYCPSSQLAAGPLTLSVSVEGKSLQSLEIRQPDARFEYDVAMPELQPGRLEVVLEVDRTTPEGDRQLGLVFGSLSIK